MSDASLAPVFFSHFELPPTRVAEAPGRVNLIGDHTDYNGLPVLPMAIRQRVRIVFRPRDDERVRIVAMAQGSEEAQFDLGHEVVRAPQGHWSNYVRGAARAVAELEGDRSRGIDALVASDIPVAAGLSSSSALVVATILALRDAAGSVVGAEEGVPEPSTLELAAFAARAERYVGTEGGGMDQAASMCGVAGHALRIRFGPLRVDPVPVPPGWRFVVAHSGVVAEKSAGVEADYNARVEGCRQALIKVARGQGLDEGTTYPALLDGFTPAELVRLADQHLAGTELAYLRHTLTEAARVEGAVAALRDEDGLAFGALMNDSHRSLRDDYGVSLDVLDRMTRAAIEAGALGARLTGAGFGGSVVALAPDTGAEAVLAALAAEVSRSKEGADPVAFVAVASDGARVRALNTAS